MDLRPPFFPVPPGVFTVILGAGLLRPNVLDLVPSSGVLDADSVPLPSLDGRGVGGVSRRNRLVCSGGLVKQA